MKHTIHKETLMKSEYYPSAGWCITATLSKVTTSWEEYLFNEHQNWTYMLEVDSSRFKTYIFDDYCEAAATFRDYVESQLGLSYNF